MSRIGKQPIPVPDGVEITIEPELVKVKGPKGELEERVSRPGRRVYARKDRLPRVLGGLGTAILSTSTGLVTSRQAAERGIGGEVIAFVW